MASSEDSTRVQRNLQAILKWSLQQQDQDSSQHVPAKTEEDKERLVWLREALDSVSHEPSETDLLKAVLSVLRASLMRGPSFVSSASEAERKEVDNLLVAFQQLQYLVEDMDHASDLIPLQGVPVIIDYIKSSDHQLSTTACEVVAVSTQNHAQCQVAFLPALPLLLALANPSHSSAHPITLSTAAVHGISCLVREHLAGLVQLLKQDGVPVLLSCLQSGYRRIVIKTLFMLLSFYTSVELKNLLAPYSVPIASGIVALLSSSLASTDSEVLQHSLSTLLAVLSGSEPALKECRRKELKLEAVLNKRLTEAMDHEVKSTVIAVQKLCFPG